MYISFEEISEKARIWIYQTDRTLLDSEIDRIEEQGRNFVNQWEAHSKTLQASFKVFHKHFLVIAVDEKHNMTTGCAIDSSVGFIKNIAHQLNIDLFDKTKIAFLLNNKVHLKPLKNIKSEVTQGTITQETFTFNNLVNDKTTFEAQWLTPVKNTWLSKYF